MRRTKTRHIADVLQQVLRNEGLETPLNEYRLIQAWPGIIPPAYRPYTRALHIRQQRLHVQVTSAPLRANLILQRSTLTHALNQAVGAQIITDILFI